MILEKGRIYYNSIILCLQDTHFTNDIEDNIRNDKVFEMMAQFNLTDIFREAHPDKKRYMAQNNPL